MAYFAELDGDNIVVRVLSVPDSEEHRGSEFLAHDLGLAGTWMQTSYTSQGGVRRDPQTNQVIEGSSHFRYNFAGIGFSYDPDRDAFIPPKPYPEAYLDESTCLWLLPTEIEIDLYAPAELTE
jgi:hypothetical protein